MSVAPLCCLISISIKAHLMFFVESFLLSLIPHPPLAKVLFLCSPKAKPLERVICTPVSCRISCSLHLPHWASALSCHRTSACQNHQQSPVARSSDSFPVFILLGLSAASVTVEHSLFLETHLCAVSLSLPGDFCPISKPSSSLSILSPLGHLTQLLSTMHLTFKFISLPLTPPLNSRLIYLHAYLAGISSRILWQFSIGAVTNYHRLGGLKQHLFVISRGLWVRSLGTALLSCVLCLGFHPAEVKMKAVKSDEIKIKSECGC